VRRARSGAMCAPRLQEGTPRPVSAAAPSKPDRPARCCRIPMCGELDLSRTTQQLCLPCCGWTAQRNYLTTSRRWLRCWPASSARVGSRQPWGPAADLASTAALADGAGSCGEQPATACCWCGFPLPGLHARRSGPAHTRGGNARRPAPGLNPRYVFNALWCGRTPAWPHARLAGGWPKHAAARFNPLFLLWLDMWAGLTT